MIITFYSRTGVSKKTQNRTGRRDGMHFVETATSLRCPKSW